MTLFNIIIIICLILIELIILYNDYRLRNIIIQKDTTIRIMEIELDN
jgi:hypothetical protein